MTTLSDAAASKVVGYFARDTDRILLDGNACIVTGSAMVLESLVRDLPLSLRQTLAGDTLDFRVQKIRFGAIVEGLNRGGAYAFDRFAYEHFRDLANQIDFDLSAFEEIQPEAAAAGARASDSTSGLELITLTLLNNAT